MDAHGLVRVGDDGVEITGECSPFLRSGDCVLPRMEVVSTRRTIMSDDKSNSGGQDRQRINVNQDYELRDWAKSLNTTPERLKEAVQAVGDRADKVREYLGQDKPNR
jgi:Protein of unknown function (DUF3606)